MQVDFKLIEKEVVALGGPLFLQFWDSNLLPAIRAAAMSGSPEIQVLEEAGIAALDAIVRGEIKALSA